MFTDTTILHGKCNHTLGKWYLVVLDHRDCIQCFASWLSMCKVEMALIHVVEISIVATTTMFIQLSEFICTWTTNLQSTVAGCSDLAGGTSHKLFKC
jgi:hypothetical protein